jgi:hypothetical protein
MGEPVLFSPARWQSQYESSLQISIKELLTFAQQSFIRYHQTNK